MRLKQGCRLFWLALIAFALDRATKVWSLTLEGGVEGHLAGFCWEGRVFSLTIETDYGFASVASSVDLRDLDALQRSYITSLKEMGRFLDLLLKNTALFAARD